MKSGLFDIPELFTQVASYLHPTDLFACIQVSHAFYKIFIPHLWHTIDDSTEPWITIFQRPIDPSPAYTSSFPPRDPHKNRDWLFGIFQKHGQHIRHLRIQFLEVLQTASAGGACTGLKSLVVTVSRYEEEKPKWVCKSSFSPRQAYGQLAPTGGLFGQPAQNGGLFGQPAQTGGLFGQPAQNGRLFGQPAQTGGLFGQPPQTGGLFGQPAQTGGLFGQPAQNGGLFGQPAQTGGLFGQPPQTGGLFGQPAQTGGLFGQPAQNGGLFGQPAQTGGLFGQPPQTGGLFGQPAQTGGLFGQPAQNGGLFGQPAQTGGLFGQPPQTGGLFGQPAQTGGLFGQPPQTGGLFGQPAQTGGLFGQPAQNGGLFGQPAQTGGLFGQPAQTDGLFGGPSGVPTVTGGDAGAVAEVEVEEIPGGYGGVVPAAVPGELGVSVLDVADSVATFAGGLFGVAPPPPPAAGFGRCSWTEINMRAPPQPHSELSKPLFPDLLTETDVVPELFEGQRLTAGSKKAIAEYEWANTQHLWHLVRTNPGLEQLDSCRAAGFASVSAEFSLATMRSLRNLKVLNARFKSEKIEFWKLWRCLPAGIESLSVKLSVFPLPNPLPEAYSTSLKDLDALGSTTINGLLTLLGILPSLERLTVGDVQPNPINPFDSSFMPLPPSPLGGQSLRRLGGVVHDWNSLLRYLPSIVEWSNGGLLREGDVALLAERFPRLESFKTHRLQLGIGQWVDPRTLSDPTNQFLATSSHLREFNSIENCVRVDEMLRQPWACMGLERLVCSIVGVDRLNDEEEAAAARVMAAGYSGELTEEEKGAVEKLRRCRAQHYGVYDRLASLTRLKHLDLGHENRISWEYKGGNGYIGEDGYYYLTYPGPEFDTLELTLESGLGRLTALKDLEMFGFECLNHRIGYAEMDWMAKSWPKLKLMYGLARERLVDIEHDKKRIALRKYFKRLRPEVIHDSLSEDHCNTLLTFRD